MAKSKAQKHAAKAKRKMAQADAIQRKHEAFKADLLEKTGLTSNTVLLDPIDWTDENDAYEQVAQGLVQIGLDWKKVRNNGVGGTCLLPGHPAAKAFDLPPSPRMENGEPTIAFAVYAGIYEGLKQTLASIVAQRGKGVVRSLTLSGNDIAFVIS